MPDLRYPVLVSGYVAETLPLVQKFSRAGYNPVISVSPDGSHSRGRRPKTLGVHTIPKNLIGVFSREEFEYLTDGMKGVDDIMAEPVSRPATRRSKPSVPLSGTESIAPEEVDTLGEIEELDSVELVDGPTVEVTTRPPKDKTKTAEAPAKKPTTDKPAASVPPSVASLADEIDAAGAERDWRHRWIFFGFNKAGKTRTQDDPNTLIVNTEDGTVTIADKPVGERAMQIQVRNKKKLEQIYWMLRSCKPHESGRGLWVPTKLGLRHIDTITFDTVTRLVFWALREEALGPTHAPDLTKEMPKVTLPMRGDAYNWVTQWLLLFRDLPLHTNYLCQQREPNEKDAVPETVIGIPDMPPSVRNVIQGDADVIGRVFIKNDDDGNAVARIQFGASEEYITGDRFFVLPKIVKHTTFRKLLSFVEKKRAERAAGE